MNVIGKRMSARLRGDLSAAFREVIAAIADGRVDCAARREAIPRVLRIHQSVLRTLRPVLIASPEDQTACPVALGHIGGQLGRDRRSLRSEAESSGVPALPNVKTAR